MKTNYELRIYDTVLLTFSITQGELGRTFYNIEKVNRSLKRLFPLDLELTADGIFGWMERRVIPKNRTFVQEVLKTLGLSANDTKGIIDVCKGLSLNDSYWIVPEGFDGTYAQYNLYENRFSEILSLVAYTGVGGSKEAFSTSPELTTGGMLPKAWRLIEDDGIYLYKGGTSGAANAGNEPYSEYYACQIAQTMGANAISYGLENWKGILASTCKLFTDIDTAYLPIGRILRRGGIEACRDYYEKQGESFSEAFKSMLVFDALVYNEDRHFGNFGVLRDNRSGEIVAPAPLFDHGISLFNFSMQDEWAELGEYAKTRTVPYRGWTFDSIAAWAMGKAQKEQLRKLIGFTFTRHPSINLPEERLSAIEGQVQSRVQQLLDLEPRESGMKRKKPKDNEGRG